VREHPDGLIFHHPLWLQVLREEFGQESLSLACVDQNNEFRGILPLFYTRGLPFGVSQVAAHYTGRRLSSLPRTPLCGPLSTSRQATALLLEAALGKTRRDAHVRLEIKTEGCYLDGLIEGLSCIPWRYSYVLKLPDRSQGPFRVADKRNRARINASIKKASRLGVRVRPAETERDLQEWYTLYLEVQRRTAVPPRPYRFFTALWNLLRPRGMLELLLAERGNTTPPIAGSLFLMYGRATFYAFGASRHSELFLRPNDAIQWEAINRACVRGFDLFDFGEVPEDGSELARFKRKWGAEPVRLYRYYYPAPSLSVGAVFTSCEYGRLIGRAAWNHLPLRAIERLGDRIYRYL
jgi:CelD/BcsL family acetyltransferase involved in cellulose biosynthesis